MSTEYTQRRAQIWVLQVRSKGTNNAWSVTGRSYFHDRKSVLEAIQAMTPMNLEYYEYRPMKYLPTKLENTHAEPTQP